MPGMMFAAKGSSRALSGEYDERPFQTTHNIVILDSTPWYGCHVGTRTFVSDGECIHVRVNGHELTRIVTIATIGDLAAIG